MEVLTDVAITGNRATPAIENLLQVNSVSYAYPNGTVAIADISLSIAPGEFVSIIGPSGCGKSTLLALIDGSLRPAAGKIEWSAEVANKSSGPTRQRLLSKVFQRDTVLPWLTVEQNAALGLRYLDLPKEEKRARVNNLLSLARLDQARHVRPEQLSGGMRRRVALLTAVAPLPKLLLMDEPFSGLDEPTRVQIHTDLRKIFREVGLSVLLVTHDLAEALSLSDRLYIFSAHPGRVVSTLTVPFGSERDLMTLRQEHAYQDMYSIVWERLSREISRSGP